MTEKRKQGSRRLDATTAMAQRLSEVARSKWDGNISRMARELGIPQPAVWKMVNGKQPLSSQLLIALVQRSMVNLHWLLSGKGPRFLEGAAANLRGQAVVRPAIPVAAQVLPAPPAACQNLLADQATDPINGVFTATQYWIEIKKTDAVAQRKDEQLMPGDWLLLETDPACFPPQHKMEDRLVVVPCSGQDSTEPKLARVEEVDDEDVLHVDTFDLGIDPSLLSEEIVVRRVPGDKLVAFQRDVVREVVERGSRKFELRREATEEELSPWPVPVRYADLLAVCVLRVRR